MTVLDHEHQASALDTSVNGINIHGANGGNQPGTNGGNANGVNSSNGPGANGGNANGPNGASLPKLNGTNATSSQSPPSITLLN